MLKIFVLVRFLKFPFVSNRFWAQCVLKRLQMCQRLDVLFTRFLSCDLSLNHDAAMKAPNQQEYADSK